MSDAISPLATPFPSLPPIAGVRIATVRAGYKTWDRHDLTLVTLDAGTLTTSIVEVGPNAR